MSKPDLHRTARLVDRGRAAAGGRHQAPRGRPTSCATCGSPGATRTAIRGRKPSPCRRSCRRWTPGYNIGVATTTLDSAGARVFASFTRGGGMGLDEMTGSPNLTVVADPATFRVLPWAPGTGWILCDEYFNDGRPFHFAPRQLLRKALQETRRARLCLRRRRRDRVVSAARRRRSSERGQYRRARHARPADRHLAGGARLSLPLRIQHGSDAAGVRCARRRFRSARARAALDRERMGPRPGRVHFRAARGAGGGRQRVPVPHRDAADLPPPRLFRDLHEPAGAARAIMRAAGTCISRWSMRRAAKESVRCGKGASEVLSPLGQSYLAGLLDYAVPGTVFATPTVNGYRRFRANSLAPDRAGWGYDNRGAMIRVLGGPGDPATRLENRIGEPAANPYLYIAVAGRRRARRHRSRTCSRRRPTTRPTTAERPPLPKSLRRGARRARQGAVVPRARSAIFSSTTSSRSSAPSGAAISGRSTKPASPQSEEPTAWEQNEYFDFF